MVRNFAASHMNSATVRAVLVVIILATNAAISLEMPDLRKRTNFVSARKGAVNIGYMLSVHSMSADGVCSVVRPHEIVCFEAFKMAVDAVNRRPDILPNISLGFVAVDDCLDETKATEMAVYMMTEHAWRPAENRSSCSGGGSNNSAGDYYYDDGARVVGVTGLATSSLAVSVSPYFGVYHVPTLSVYATSDSLDDKTRHRYFSRLVPPDRFQVETLLRLADRMDWTFVALVFSEGAYGENAAAQVYRLLRTWTRSDVCVSVAVKIPADATEKDFDDAARRLTLNPRSRVALTFVEEVHMAGLFDAVRVRTSATGRRILWLSGDGLDGHQSSSFADVLEGGIYTDPPSALVPGIEDHVSAMRPWLEPDDVWFSILWEELFRCRLDGYGDGTAQSLLPPCDRGRSFGEMSGSIDWGWSQIARVYDSVVVLATAVDAMLRTECPEAASAAAAAVARGEPIPLLDRCLARRTLLEYVRNVSIDGIAGRTRFDERGNLIGDLIVKQYQRGGSSSSSLSSFYVSVRIGLWNSSSNDIHLDTARIDWTGFRNDGGPRPADAADILESVCSRPCGPTEYAVQTDGPCCWTCARCRSNEVVDEAKTGCKPCPPLTWPDEDSATVCAPIRPDVLRATHPLSVTLLFFSSTGCALSLATVVVYRLKRHHRVVKATSYHLSLVMLCGAALANVAAGLFAIVPTTELCIARELGFHFGINLLYGPLLVKNVRTYRIFRSGEKSARIPLGVGPKAQLVFAGCISVLQALLLAVSEAVSPSSVGLKMPSPYVKFVERYCSKDLALFVVPLGYNIALMTVCAAIGFITRKLPENFNESAYIFASVSMTLFSWVIFVPAYLAQSSQALQPAVMGFCLVINSYIALACQFFRVVYAVFFIAPKEFNCGPKSIVVPNSAVQPTRVQQSS